MPHIAIDVETTGLEVSGSEPSEIVQIGAYCLHQETMAPTARRFEVKMPIMHPERVQPNTMGIYNTYDEAVWKGQAVSPDQGWKMLVDFLHECSGGGIAKNILVGHNVPKFDYQLIDRWSRHYGVTLPCDYNVLDTLTTFNTWKMVTGSTIRNLSLKTMAKAFGVENPHAHDALCDAWTEGMCYALCLNDLRARMQCDPGWSDADYLDEAYRRIGAPRNGKCMPLLNPDMLIAFSL